MRSVRNELGIVACIALPLASFLSQPALAVDTTCSSANNTVICIADLDGTGKQNVIVGHMPPYTPGIGNVGDSYLFILDHNGAVRRTLCMGNGSGQSAQCPPYLLKGPGT